MIGIFFGRMGIWWNIMEYHFRWEESVKDLILYSRDTELICRTEQAHQEAHVPLLCLWQTQLPSVNEPQTMAGFCWAFWYKVEAFFLRNCLFLVARKSNGFHYCLPPRSHQSVMHTLNTSNCGPAWVLSTSLKAKNNDSWSIREIALSAHSNNMQKRSPVNHSSFLSWSLPTKLEASPTSFVGISHESWRFDDVWKRFFPFFQGEKKGTRVRTPEKRNGNR